MKRFAKYLALLLGCAFLLSGCGSVSMDKYAQTPAATYGDKTIYMDEANFWLQMSKLDYSYMEYMYRTYYGVTDFWAQPSGVRTQTNAQTLREEVMAQFLQLNILLDHAQELGVTLSEEDKAQVTKAMGELKNNYKALFSADMIGDYSDDKFRASLEERALALKVWKTVSEQKNVDVKDEDCVSFTLNYFLIGSGTSITPKAEDGSSLAPISGADAANVLMINLKEGKEFNDLRTTYSNVTASTISYRRTDENSADRPLFKIGKDLKDGDVVTQEMDGSYYVVQCVSADDKTAAESARESLANAQRAEHFNSVYAEWKKSAKAFSVKGAFEQIPILPLN